MEQVPPNPHDLFAENLFPKKSTSSEERLKAKMYYFSVRLYRAKVEFESAKYDFDRHFEIDVLKRQHDSTPD